MNIQQAREAVYERFATQWTALHPSVPYTFEQEFFKEPTAGQWARCTVRNLGSDQETLGSAGARTFQRPANVYVQVFDAVNAGMETLDGMAKDVLTIFEGVSFGGIVPRGAGAVVEVGDDGKWYEVVVTIPIFYYETK